MLNADLTVSKYSKDFQKRLSLQISLGRPRCDRGQRWCGQYCQVGQLCLEHLKYLQWCCYVVNVIRLSSGEKLGVLSQGPGIVYDVKMVGLKVEKNEWIAIDCFQNKRGRAAAKQWIVFELLDGAAKPPIQSSSDFFKSSKQIFSLILDILILHSLKCLEDVQINPSQIYTKYIFFSWFVGIE